MRLLLSHTIRSIKDNAAQLAVILLTVTVVTAMFFATLTVGGLFTNLQTSLKARLGGDTDLSVSGGVFSEAAIDEYLSENADSVEYTEKYMQTGALYRPSSGDVSKAVLIEATDLTSYISRHASSLVIYDSYEYSYSYPAVWIGRSFAEENGIKAGDVVEVYVEMYQLYRKLTVTYVFENYGIFANSVVNNLLVDLDTLANKGLLNLVNIKLTDNADRTAFEEGLKAKMGEGIEVGESVDYAEIDRIVGSNQTLLNIALIFVAALMAFILFTAFLVMARKRIPELMLFRTVGASRGTIVAMLFAEGLVYGLAGAVVGTVIGRIGMGLVADNVIPNFPDAVTFGFTDYLFSILFGTAVSGLSALFPSLRASRDSVRKVTSDKTGASKRPKSVLPLIISAAVMTAAALCVAFVKVYTVVFTVFLVAAAAVFVFFAIPYVLRAVSALFGKKGSAGLASMSIKRNPLNRTLSGLVGFVVVFTFVIVSIVNVIIGAVTPANERFNADFVVAPITQTDLKKVSLSLENVYGIEDINLHFYDTFIWETDTQNVEYTVYGTDNSSGLEGLGKGWTEEIKLNFDTTLNPVIISYDMAKRLGLKEGDVIKLTLSDGRTLYDEFTVIGIDETVTSNDRVMIIRNSSFRIDAKDYTPDDGMIFLKVRSDVSDDDLYRELRDRLEGELCYILEFTDWAYATSVGIRGVVTLLKILQVLIGAVASVGVVNLTLVTLMSRRREYNIYESVGLDGRGYVRLSLAESLIVGLSGAAVGVGLSLIANLLVPVFAEIIDRFPTIAVFPWFLAVTAVCAVAFYGFIYLMSALFRRKKQSIERNVL